MKKIHFRYTSPIVIARKVTQAEKDQAAERRRYKPNGTRKAAR